MRTPVSEIERSQLCQPFSLFSMSKIQEKPPAPLILPPSYTTNTPPESFDDPARGEITWHTLISAPKTDTSDLSVGIAICPPKTGHLCAHRHAQAEVYHILEGEGEGSLKGLRRRAYTIQQFEQLAAASSFGGGEVNGAGIGLELRMKRL